jgi:hypothetical protein
MLNLAPLSLFSSPSSSPSAEPLASLERHPEFTGGGCAAVLNVSSIGMAAQQQLPAPSKTVSGERSSGACAAVITVSAGGSPPQQLLSGLPRDVFPAMGSAPAMAGPPAGIQESQLPTGSTVTVTIR